MIRAGMNVARLNFSHGDFAGHEKVIQNLRAASREVGRRVAIMGDLPGPKMRIGEFAEEPIELKRDDDFTLTAEDVTGTQDRVSMSFESLPRVVKPGDKLYFNDGIINLEVVRVEGQDVQCKVLVGGELRSGKGLNLPGIDLGISAFTDHDHDCLKFAMENGVDAVSQSFVERAADICAVRDAAAALGRKPFIIAKIERSGALGQLDEIFEAADGIMIARGDLGVEIPIERIALVQKELMEKANRLGKPVITATQMLESMTKHSKPTRAEATDVANAVLDGTDCVMLSGESAMGQFPVEAVTMLANIAATVEPHRTSYRLQEALKTYGKDRNLAPIDLIALSVHTTVERSTPATVIVPTVSGSTARNIARFRLPVWITAVSSQEATCHYLQFSYGVHAVHEPAHPENWNAYARDFLRSQGIAGGQVVLTEGPSPDNPQRNHRMDLIDLAAETSGD
jgi:pyruvate kinase